jgi:hypothetical protein
MNTLLNIAKKKFKKGDLFLTATGKVKAPLVVGNLIVAENYPEMIVNENGGVIVFREDLEDEEGNTTSEFIWAKKLIKENK